VIKEAGPDTQLNSHGGRYDSHIGGTETMATVADPRAK